MKAGLIRAILLGLFLTFSIGLQAEPSVSVVQMPVKPSPAASEVLKLHRAGVDDSMLLAFVDSKPQLFNLSSDDILFLQDEGVAETVTMAILKHDSRILEQWAALQAPDPGQDLNDAQGEDIAQSQPSYVENPPEEVATFYNDLAPHGSWIYLEDQGWCWQPNAAAADATWEPYLDNGRWLYSDAGWYWDSGYTWGWAPFHYGRWWNAPRCGWVWFPDTVWAPSWCSWRYSNKYCGWTPLGPSFFPGQFGLGMRHFGYGDHAKGGSDSFTFVGVDHLFDHNLRPYRTGSSEGHGLYNRTMPGATPFARGNMVVNQGAPISDIAKASGKTIPTVPISTVRVDPKSTQPGVQKSGHNDVIALPKLSTPTHFSGMVAQRVGPNASVSTLGTRGATIREPAGATVPGSPEVFPWHGPSPQSRTFRGPDDGFAPSGRDFGSHSRFGAPGIEIGQPMRVPEGYPPGQTPVGAAGPAPIGAAGPTPGSLSSPSLNQHQSFGSGHQTFQGGHNFNAPPSGGSAATPPPSIGGNPGTGHGGGGHPTGGAGAGGHGNGAGR